MELPERISRLRENVPLNCFYNSKVVFRPNVIFCLFNMRDVEIKGYFQAVAGCIKSPLYINYSQIAHFYLDSHLIRNSLDTIEVF